MRVLSAFALSLVKGAGGNGPRGAITPFHRLPPQMQMPEVGPAAQATGQPRDIFRLYLFRKSATPSWMLWWYSKSPGATSSPHSAHTVPLVSWVAMQGLLCSKRPGRGIRSRLAAPSTFWSDTAKNQHQRYLSIYPCQTCVLPANTVFLANERWGLPEGVSRGKLQCAPADRYQTETVHSGDGTRLLRPCDAGHIRRGKHGLRSRSGNAREERAA